MRILYHFRTQAADGSGVHIQRLVEALSKNGATVRVIGPAIAARSATRTRRQAVMNIVRRILPKPLHELAELLLNVPEVVRLFRAAREFKPDVLYERTNLFLTSGVVVSRCLSIPLIVEANSPYFLERSRHGGICFSALAQWSERIAWTHADAVIAVSECLAEIIGSEGVTRDRLHVMPNGVADDLITQKVASVVAKRSLGLEDRVVLGFTGFIRQWNGLGPVVDLLASDRCSNCTLLIVGDGPARVEIENRARARGVEDRVKITGVVDHEQVPTFVSAFDIALQPAANSYASPLKLIEYMALERAILAPDQANIRELLTDGVDALLFDASSSFAFESALIRLVEDEKLRQRLACGSFETLKRRGLTWQRNAERVVDLAGRLGRGRSVAAAVR
jgi:glycosyltransferase involved in cell wall biosynthesis